MNKQQAVQYIKDQGIPVDDHMDSGVYVNRDLTQLTSEQYCQHITAITGQPSPFTLQAHNRMLFAYLCQYVVESHNKQFESSIDQCFQQSVDKINYHIKHNSYFFYEDSNQSNPIVVNGVNRQKGWKTQQAVEYMKDNKFITKQQFVQWCKDQLGMGDSGANTYWITTHVKVHGCKPSSQRKKRKLAAK